MGAEARHGLPQPLVRKAIDPLQVGLLSCGVGLGERGPPSPAGGEWALLQENSPDTSPAKMHIDALKDERREVLNFERECALDLEDQGCRRSSRLTLGTPSARRPDDLDRLCHSGQPFADDLLPIEQKTGLAKTLPLRHPVDGRG